MGFLPTLLIFCRFICMSFIVGLKHAGKTFDIVESKKFVFGDVSDGSMEMEMPKGDEEWMCLQCEKDMEGER